MKIKLKKNSYLKRLFKATTRIKVLVFAGFEYFVNGLLMYLRYTFKR